MSNSVDWLALLDQAKESGVAINRDPVPQGRYALKVIKAEATVSSNNNTMYKITAEIQNGPHAGRYIFDNITLTENTATWFFRKMNALGADEAYFRTLPEPPAVAAKIDGAFFEAEVEIEPARGNYEPRNRIAKWFRPNAGSAAQASHAPAPQAYNTPAPVPQQAPQQAAPAPQQAPQQDPWGQAQAPQQQAAPAPAPQQGQSPWGQAPAGAPAPAPAAPWDNNAPTPF